MKSLLLLSVICYVIFGILLLPSLFFAVGNVLFALFSMYLFFQKKEDIMQKIWIYMPIVLIGVAFNYISFIFVILALILALRNKSEDELEYIKIKVDLPIDPQTKRINRLLQLGIGMVCLSGIIFATSSWESIPNFVKVIGLFFISCLFLGMSKFSETKFKVRKSMVTYWILGLSFLAFTYLSAGFFEIFGTWFSVMGEGRYLFLTTFYAWIAIMMLFSHYKFKENILLYFVYAALVFSGYEWLVYMEFSYSYQLLLCSIIVLLANAALLFEKGKKEINYFVSGATYIGSFYLMGLIGLTQPMMGALTGLFLITSLILVLIKRKEAIFQYSAPFLIVFLIVRVCFLIPYENEVIFTFISISYLFYYLIVLWVPQLKTREYFRQTSFIIINVATLPLLILSFFLGHTWVLLSAIILYGYTIATYLNKSLAQNKLEYYLAPGKLLLLVWFFLYYLSGFDIIIAEIYIYVISAVVMGISYLITKDKHLQKQYVIFYFIMVGLGVFTPTGYHEDLGRLLNLVTAAAGFLMAENKKTNSKVSNLAYFLLLMAIYLTMVYENIMYVTEEVALFATIAVLIAQSFVYRKQPIKIFLTYTVVFFTCIHLIGVYDLPWEFWVIFVTGYLWFLLGLFCQYVLKTPYSKAVISTLFSIMILLFLVFQYNTVIAIYTGIVSLLLIAIGYRFQVYRRLFKIGIVFTIITILIHTFTLWSGIQFWAYLFFGGIALIGFVTYKEIKKNKEKK